MRRGCVGVMMGGGGMIWMGWREGRPIGETVVDCFSQGPFFVEEFCFVKDSMNIEGNIIENDIVSFFPNVPNNENEFYNFRLIQPKSGEPGEQAGVINKVGKPISKFLQFPKGFKTWT